MPMDAPASAYDMGHAVEVEALATFAVFVDNEPGVLHRVVGLFAGLRTGPIAWLGEADSVHDDTFPGGRTLVSGLLEGNWRLLKGHNLKVTVEYFDPDRSVRENQRARYSLVYELTPWPFMQLRAGYRRYRGIPQSNVENQRLSFVELHGHF